MSVTTKNEMQTQTNYAKSQSRKSQIRKSERISLKQLNEDDKKIFDLSDFNNENQELDLLSKEILLNSNKNIKCIPHDIIQKCTKLKEIDFSSNQIRALHSDTFIQSTELKLVDFSSNQIEDLQLGIFKKCEQLQSINFSSNQIKSLRSNKIEDLNQCEDINFSSNKIAKLDKVLFSEFLVQIEFSSNQIKKIEPGTFEKCKELKCIDFSLNQIYILDEKIFSACKKLAQINFSSNQIKELDSSIFKECKKLLGVNFSSNQIEKLPKEIFEECRKLKEVDFSSNQIKELNPNIFPDTPCENPKANKESNPNTNVTNTQGKNLEASKESDQITTVKCLEVVCFNSNQILKLDPALFKNCKYLQKIDFSSNQIKELHKDTFITCPRLEEIDFSSNNIKELDKDTFIVCKKLKTVDFNSNQLKNFNIFIFKSDCEWRVRVSFSDNLIQRVSYFDNLKSPFELDLRNNFKTINIQSFYSYFYLTKTEFNERFYVRYLTKDQLAKKPVPVILEPLLKEYNQTNESKYQTFLYRCSDIKFFKETFFLLFFNKNVYNLHDKSFVTASENFNSNFKKFENFEWSLLDFLVVYVEKLGATNLTNLNSHIPNHF
jgi:Leucine-rich repeat (LRR) protein